ncbi:hypothetical protein [Sedimentitalea todarodis]|uniref:Uncharacterized protein n=1 Tax=Sedimentitalea todarodis TaxID=1631240 RepID=A0ABU3VEB2_9RHOB|nr:hypothetical protein [Sedimentitalea todarodis]MDU9004502.1 hypothetical protein [Sedimentitalea todarodis]
MFDRNVPEDSWRRLRDALWNNQCDFRNRISLSDWLRRNRALKKRLKNGLPSDDSEILELACVHHGMPGRKAWDVVHMMQKELLADQRRYSELKRSGELYDRDEDGHPLHTFCWLDYFHLQTEAILSCENILNEAGIDTSLTDTRTPEIDAEGQIVPTPFEEFCFTYIFKGSVKEFRTRDGEDSHRVFQRVRDAQRQRGKLKPKSEESAL